VERNKGRRWNGGEGEVAKAVHAKVDGIATRVRSTSAVRERELSARWVLQRKGNLPLRVFLQSCCTVFEGRYDVVE